MYFLLELGGKTLNDYFYLKVRERHGNLRINSVKLEQLLLTNILKGAAQALQQFHQPLDENQSEPNPDPASNETIPVKLIDFNISVIHSKGHVAHFDHMIKSTKAPEISDNNPANVTI
uniref:Uncharacterized protein n=1 Tax=Meloidogyne enterolobii TaxID=390850 RepID=A0A6V7UA07_MELEN|nr:unnamed protein product [Meloidogyne enterolobii]